MNAKEVRDKTLEYENNTSRINLLISKVEYEVKNSMDCGCWSTTALGSEYINENDARRVVKHFRSQGFRAKWIMGHYSTYVIISWKPSIWERFVEWVKLHSNKLVKTP